MEFQADNSKDKIRLDNAVSDFLPDFTRSKIQKMIETGAITVNSKIVKPSFKIKRKNVRKKY